MTRKTIKFPKKEKSTKPKQKKTPFADTGRLLGGIASNVTGIPGLGNLGKLLGSHIGSIFGSGDYRIAGPTPTMNVLQGSPPKFSSTRATNIVCHREYIKDITGTTAFANTVLRLNPGDTQTFPWLSTVAANYSQYRFHGVVFEFKSLITDFVVGGAPGVVIMSTNYNADDPAFTNKRQMENSEFAVSVKPTENIMHMIECAPDQTSINELYVRLGNNPTGIDLKTTDLAAFQLATQGNPAQLLGELWVTYCVEFFKPEMVTSGLGFSSRVERTSAASALINFGTTLVRQLGTINATTGANAIAYFGLLPLTNYAFNFTMYCNGAFIVTPVLTPGPGTIVTGEPSAAGTNQANAISAYTAGSGNFVYDVIIKSDATGAITVNLVDGTTAAPALVNTDTYLMVLEQAVNP